MLFFRDALASLPSRAGDLFNCAVLQQQTLDRPVSFSGIGLHSGNRVTMTFLPAAANTGMRFRRVDLEGKPEIEARVENVARNQPLDHPRPRATPASIPSSTSWPPSPAAAWTTPSSSWTPTSRRLRDGSAREYCRMIEQAGIVPQPEKREPYPVTEPIELQAGRNRYGPLPGRRLQNHLHQRRQARAASPSSTASKSRPKPGSATWPHARTFCFYEEIEFLIRTA